MEDNWWEHYRHDEEGDETEVEINFYRARPSKVRKAKARANLVNIRRSLAEAAERSIERYGI